jgi:histidyl-tRNA synthetase
MSTLKAVRGTRDLLPPETALWNRIEQTARQVFARYNFGEIRTPIFEDTALFARSVGEETDIVSKEMYTWEDRERFNSGLLKAAWMKLGRGEYSQTLENAKIEDERVDLVAHRQGVYNERPVHVIELVEFKQEVIPFDVERLSHLMFQFRGFPEGAHIFGVIAIPAKRNLPAITPELARELRMSSMRGYSGDNWIPLEGDPPADDPKATRRVAIRVETLEGDFFASSQRLTLRPENTAGVVRAYIEYKLGESGQLQKLYYIGPQFRRERPQKGRYRQFWQIGAEVIGPPSSGSESPLRDAEILEMLATLLDELHITGWTLELNSVGSAADRARYNDVLRAALLPVAAKMCVDCQRRAVTNPLRVLDCKVPEDQPIIETLPKIFDSLDEESKNHFAQVLAALDAAQVPYTRNHRLVRGLDYYTRTTFEFTHGGLGAQNALLGGGRYDGLSEALGGPRAPGIGFAIGLDRLVLTLQAQQAGENAAGPKVDAYVAPLGDQKNEALLVRLNAAALVLARELRRAGLGVELGDASFRLKKSFEAADKIARAIVILGEDELQSGILTVKNFLTGVQTKIPRAELSAHLKKPVGEVKA